MIWVYTRSKKSTLFKGTANNALKIETLRKYHQSESVMNFIIIEIVIVKGWNSLAMWFWGAIKD